jgi:hypothetical protein
MDWRSNSLNDGLLEVMVRCINNYWGLSGVPGNENPQASTD